MFIMNLFIVWEVENTLWDTPGFCLVLNVFSQGYLLMIPNFPAKYLNDYK